MRGPHESGRQRERAGSIDPLCAFFCSSGSRSPLPARIVRAIAILAIEVAKRDAPGAIQSHPRWGAPERTIIETTARSRAEIRVL